MATRKKTKRKAKTKRKTVAKASARKKTTRVRQRPVKKTPVRRAPPKKARPTAPPGPNRSRQPRLHSPQQPRQRWPDVSAS